MLHELLLSCRLSYLREEGKLIPKTKSLLGCLLSASEGQMGAAFLFALGNKALRVLKIPKTAV